jgi:hypothetical protein
MESLSPWVTDFADRYLTSLEDLRVLAACMDDRERWWDALGMARQLSVTVAVARLSLDQLARSNLLDIRITGDVRYRFRPGSSELDAQANGFATAYRADPVRVVQYVAGSCGRGARDFADAFKLRRDDDR